MLNWSWQKLTLATVVFAVVAAGAIWIAWELEESRKPVRTRVIGEDDSGGFVVEMEEQEHYDLIVHCDEEKYKDAFEKFTDHAEVDPTYPALRVPGGPMVIALADFELPEDLQPVKRATIEYLKQHAPRRVVLVAHSECLLYDTIAAWRDNLDEVKQHQHEHLVAARAAIKRWFPDTEVELFYADRAGNRLTFLRMADELPAPSLLGGDAIENDSRQ